jgi:hypothetical protein
VDLVRSLEFASALISSPPCFWHNAGGTIGGSFGLLIHLALAINFFVHVASKSCGGEATTIRMDVSITKPRRCNRESNTIPFLTGGRFDDQDFNKSRLSNDIPKGQRDFVEAEGIHS